MAQIRSKQIADFLSTVDWSTVTGSKIAGALATKIYIDSQINSSASSTTEAFDSLEVLLSAEIGSTDSDVTRIDNSISSEISRATSTEISIGNRLTGEIGRATSVESTLSTGINTEKVRIDAILSASDADLDSFAEIVSLINAVDTINDDALANVIGNLSSEISSTNSDVTSIDTRATELSSTLSAEISSTNADVTSIDTRATSLADELSAEISSTNSDFVRVEGVVLLEDSIENARAISVETSINTKVTSIESALMQDFEMFEESFTGTISLTYVLAYAVQDNNKYLVKAYVNGIKTTVASVSGTSVVINNPGYSTDANDVVVITYQY
jgi:hypothetical protein